MPEPTRPRHRDRPPRRTAPAAPAEAGPDRQTLRSALEEARGPDPSAASPSAPPLPEGGPGPAGEPASGWDRLRPYEPDPRRLERNLIVTAHRKDPAHAAFDVLRTKTVAALRERGWRRVGITSPTAGCGKSFTALNLAVTLSRYESHRTVLLDLDLRLPVLARRLGVSDPGAIGDMLRGLVAPEAHLLRVAPNPLQIGPSLALGLNGRPEGFAAELFHDRRTAEALARLERALAPDILLCDLPPVLAQDDVIALRPLLDCVILVAAGGMTTPRDLKETAHRLGDDLPILGVVLNRAEGEGVRDYKY